MNEKVKEKKALVSSGQRARGVGLRRYPLFAQFLFRRYSWC
jgi:hypothetical protein